MKRLLTLAGLALASFIGAFAFTAPAHATVSCSTTTSGQFPDNRYWYCGSTSGYNSSAQGGLVNLGTNAKSATVLNNSSHNFFVFASVSDYNGYCGGTGAGSVPCDTINSNERGHTWQALSGVWYSVVIENQQGSTNTTVISTRLKNTMAHEAGHQLDIYYGVNVTGGGAASVVGKDFDTKLNAAVYGDIVKFNALSTVPCTGVGLYTSQLSEMDVEGAGTGNRYMCQSTQTATITGTPSTGSITFVVHDTTLTGGMASIIQSVTTGQSANTVATNLAANITSVLSASGISATASGAVITLVSSTGVQTTYTATVSGTEGVSIPGSPSFGTGPSLRSFYAKANNWAIVQAAWPEIFSTETFGMTTRWAELYAEETAVDYSSSEATNQTPDLYIKNDGFVCTKLIVTHLTTDGRLPTTAEYTSSHCN
jgi:hypothetical protein